MSFRKDVYQVTKAKKLFGRNVIATDNHDWSTSEIVQLSLDRYGIENQFRSSKSKDHVRLNPFYHWTDSKIRYHLLTCAIALTVLRLLELRVNRSRNEKDRLSGKTILEEMSNLDSVWLWYSGKRKPERMKDHLLNFSLIRLYGGTCILMWCSRSLFAACFVNVGGFGKYV